MENLKFKVGQVVSFKGNCGPVKNKVFNTETKMEIESIFPFQTGMKVSLGVAAFCKSKVKKGQVFLFRFKGQNPITSPQPLAFVK